MTDAQVVNPVTLSGGSALPVDHDADLDAISTGKCKSQDAPLWSVATVAWLTPLIKLANKRPLYFSDLQRSRDDLKSEEITNSFWEAWNSQYPSNGDGGEEGEGDVFTPSMLRALFKAWGHHWLRAGAFQFIFMLAQLSQPFLVRQLLDYLADEGDPPVYEGILYAVAFGLSAAVSGQMFFLVWHQAQIMGMKIRGSLMNVVYGRALHLTASARSDVSIGQTTNLMSVDAEKLFLFIQYSHFFWHTPLIFVIVLTILATIVGWAAAAGMGLMLILFPLNRKMGKASGDYRREFVKAADARVSMMNEILQHIRAVKVYGWEESVKKRIDDLRKKEAEIFKKSLFFRGWGRDMMFVNPQIIGMVIFTVYVYGLNETLTRAEYFEIMAFVSILRFPATLLAQSFNFGNDAKVALRRISEFLNREHHPSTIAGSRYVPSSESDTWDQSSDATLVSIANGSFRWSATKSEKLQVGNLSDGINNNANDTELFELRGIDLELKRGELVAIVGKVGSGKSSLFQAILGDMTTYSGQTKVTGRIAYGPQSPWIQNLTIRDNILFGTDYDEVEYQNSIRAAALSPDLALMPAGDLTEIGERGINLSGGQKARVSVARVINARHYADILLFDDPLAAVDFNTGNTIFEKGIGHESITAKHARLVSLNSHHHLLPHFDRVIVIDKGKIIGNDSFNNLKRSMPKEVLGAIVNLDSLAETETQSKAEIKISESTPIDQTSDGGAAKQLEPADFDDVISPSKARSFSAISPVGGTSKFSAPPLGKLPEEQEVEKEEVESDRKRTRRGRLSVTEARSTGFVGFGVFQQYFSAALLGGSKGFGTMLIAALWVGFAAAQTCRVLADTYGVRWAEEGGHEDVTEGYIFIGLVGGTIVFHFCRIWILFQICARISVNIHNRIFKRVLHAPQSEFFDITPTGQIINRFSSDLEKMDLQLPESILNFISNFLHVLSIIVLCVSASPYLILVLIPLGIGAKMVFTRFRAVSRDLKRLESSSRSPIYSTFSETLSGLDTIHAFGAEARLAREMHAHVNKNMSAFYQFWMSGMWLTWRLECLTSTMVLAVSLLLVALRDSVDGTLAGLALVYALQLTALLQRTVKVAIEAETHMTSVERILHFDNVPKEPPQYLPQGDANAGDNWPSAGAVEFSGVTMSYRDNPPVLRDVSFKIRAGERIGVCGRTGAGKSSLLMALFRQNPLTCGVIRIDGIDITSVGLRKLRRGLGIIPQDPVLLSGSLRFNLDPWNEHQDAAIWLMIDSVGIGNMVRSLEKQLNETVTPNGANFSCGERQLICIARTLLRHSVKVLVLDEATASIDPKTDALVQTAVRTLVGSGTTVITIAHRLQTIEDSDKICVMSAGRVVEFGTPQDLLANRKGSYYAMASLAGMTSDTENARKDSVTKKLVVVDSAGEVVKGVESEI